MKRSTIWHPFILVFFTLALGWISTACNEDYDIGLINIPPAGDEDAVESESDSRALVAYKQKAVYTLVGSPTVEKPNVFNRLPYPYDYFTKADPTTKTGLRLDMMSMKDMPVEFRGEVLNTNLVDYGLYMFDGYQESTNHLDGFSGYGGISLELSRSTDASLLPQTPEASIADDSLVWVIDIDENSPDAGKKYMMFAELKEAMEFDENYDPTVYLYTYLNLRPVNPLPERRKYAVLLRKGLTNTDGEELGPSEDFQIVADLADAPEDRSNLDLLLAERERMASVFTRIEDLTEVTRDQWLVAFDFTTQTTTHNVFYAEEGYRADTIEAAEPNFDPNDDGQPDLYAYQDYNDQSWPNFSSALKDPSVGKILRMTLELPWFLQPNDSEDPIIQNSIVTDENGDPTRMGSIEVPVVVVFPADTSKQPYPVVINQHGLSSAKEGQSSLTDEWTKEGWAVVYMDFIYHGERSPSSTSLPMEFINVAFPLQAAGSFQQSQIDLHRLIDVLHEWDYDIWPEGGDGKVDLDPERILYFGMSLGSIVGAPVVAGSPWVDCSVLDVGGAGLIDYVSSYLADYGLTDIWPEYRLVQFSNVAQNLLYPGDGIGYLQYFQNPRSEEFNTKTVLAIESINDETVPNNVTENMIRTGGFQLMKPVVRNVSLVEEIDAPAYGLVATQFEPESDWHNFFTRDTDVARTARAQMLHFFKTCLESDDGQGEVIWPDISESK